MTIHRVRANLTHSPATRREQYEGREHLVTPVVMIVEGVLNGALLLEEEFGAFPAAWNGRPVPVFHPEENGSHISAARPDVMEKNTVGTVFNTRVESKKLLGELWLDIQKIQSLGYDQLVTMLEDGYVLEVSTGYFADDEEAVGEYNGKTYTTIHRNIRPDHLALLPGQVGACSVEDGCGTRVNSKRSSLAMKVNEAWAVLGKALRLNTNCQCEENSMDILNEADKLVKANALDAKQLAAIQKMNPADREVMAAFIAALNMAGDEGETTEEDPEEMVEEDPEENLPAKMAEGKEYKAMQQNKNTRARAQMSEADIDKLVANRVEEHLRRRDVVAKLKSNERNSLTDEQMGAMGVAELEAVEKMIRPTDYSGAGGFATNSSADETSVVALLPRGLMTNREKKKEA